MGAPDSLWISCRAPTWARWVALVTPSPFWAFDVWWLSRRRLKRVRRMEVGTRWALGDSAATEPVQLGVKPVGVLFSGPQPRAGGRGARAPVAGSGRAQRCLVPALAASGSLGLASPSSDPPGPALGCCPPSGLSSLILGRGAREALGRTGLAPLSLLDGSFVLSRPSI